LTMCKNRAHVDVRHTMVSAAGVKVLKTARPHADVQSDVWADLVCMSEYKKKWISVVLKQLYYVITTE